MTKRTHLFVAAALTFQYITQNPISIIGLLGANFPDIDYKIGIRHRTITHTLIALLLLTFFITLINYKIGIVFGISFSTHLFLDSLTKTGIPLLYPFNKKYFGFKKVKTGEIEDKILGIIAISFMFYLFLK